MSKRGLALGLCAIVAATNIGEGIESALSQEKKYNDKAFLKSEYPIKTSYKQALADFQATLHFAIVSGLPLAFDINISLKVLSEKDVSGDEKKEGERVYNEGIERSAADPKDGIDYLLNFVRKNPINPEPWRGLGDICYGIEGHEKESFFYYSAYLTLNPDSLYVKERIGEIEMMLQKQYNENQKLKK